MRGMENAQARWLTKLPGNDDVWLDAGTIVCVRAVTDENGTVVVVHTDQGFAVPLRPTVDQSIAGLIDQVVRLTRD